MKLYLGHDPSVTVDDCDPGLDILLTVWEDGTQEVAVRPGRDRRDIIWSPQVRLVATS